MSVCYIQASEVVFLSLFPPIIHYYLEQKYIYTQVSFRPPFYSCQSCTPEEISNTFTKQYSAWYDDDYISQNGQRQKYANNNNNDDGAANNDDAANNADDANAANDDANAAAYDDANAAAADDGYYQAADDAYYQTNDDNYNYADDANAANDDANNNAYDDGYYNNHYVNQDDGVYYNYAAHDDDFYALNDDYNRRGLRNKLMDGGGEEVNAVVVDASHSLTAMETRKVS